MTARTDNSDPGRYSPAYATGRERFYCSIVRLFRLFELKWLFGVFSGTQMLRIRKFGENQSGYNAALLELLFLFCAASPESVFAKVMQTPQSICPGHIAI